MELRFRFVQVSDEAAQAAARKPECRCPAQDYGIGFGNQRGRAHHRLPLRRLHLHRPRDNRLRPSILIGYEGRKVLIDTTPISASSPARQHRRLHAVVFTHAHADHVMGLDDLRPFNFRQSGPIPIFAAPETMAAIRRSFPLYLLRREKGTQRPGGWTRTSMARPSTFRPGVSPDPRSARTADIYGSLRRRRLSHRPPRDPPTPRWTCSARSTSSSSTPCATSPIPPIPPWTAPRDPRALAAHRAFFTHICHDLGHERAESLLPPTFGWRVTGWKSWWEAMPDSCGSITVWPRYPPILARRSHYRQFDASISATGASPAA